MLRNAARSKIWLDINTIEIPVATSQVTFLKAISINSDMTTMASFLKLSLAPPGMLLYATWLVQVERVMD